MSEYILDSLEALIYEETGQCDLVRRRIIGFLGSREILRLKSELDREWQLLRKKEADAEWAEEAHYYEEVPDDFGPYDPDEDGA